jgi:biopolymer transport protein ExbD
MAFGAPERSADTSPMSEINMIPLIDVMLVLLVIFMITAPLLTHSVRIDLPKASSAPTLAQSQTVQIALDESGNLYWNGERIVAGALKPRIADIARRPDAEIHIRADRRTPYEKVAQIMSFAAAAGISKIAFVTEPAGDR